MFAQWQVKEGNSKFWFCDTFLATHCSQSEVHVTEVKWEEESMRRCVRATCVHGQSNSSCQSLCCQFSYLDQRFTRFLLWSPVMPYQTNNSSKTKKKQKGKSSRGTFSGCWSNLIFTQQLGAIIGSFQYRPISHSSLHSCLNMSLLNNDQFNNRGANFTKNRLFSHLKTNDSRLQTSTDSIVKQQVLFCCSPNLLQFLLFFFYKNPIKNKTHKKTISTFLRMCRFSHLVAFLIHTGIDV